MGRRSESSCRQYPQRLPRLPGGPHPGADDLAREWYERWPLAGQELAGARRAHTIRSPGQWSADAGDREHVLDGAAEAVELSDHERVTGAQVVERGREAWALRGGLPVADLLGVDPAPHLASVSASC